MVNLYFAQVFPAMNLGQNLGRNLGTRKARSDRFQFPVPAAFRTQSHPDQPQITDWLSLNRFKPPAETPSAQVSGRAFILSYMQQGRPQLWVLPASQDPCSRSI